MRWKVFHERKAVQQAGGGWVGRQTGHGAKLGEDVRWWSSVSGIARLAGDVSACIFQEGKWMTLGFINNQWSYESSTSSWSEELLQVRSQRCSSSVGQQWKWWAAKSPSSKQWVIAFSHESDYSVINPIVFFVCPLEAVAGVMDGTEAGWRADPEHLQSPPADEVGGSCPMCRDPELITSSK